MSSKKGSEEKMSEICDKQISNIIMSQCGYCVETWSIYLKKYLLELEKLWRKEARMVKAAKDGKSQFPWKKLPNRLGFMSKEKGLQETYNSHDIYKMMSGMIRANR